MANAVRIALDRFGRLDIVVANAGIERIGAVRTQPPVEFERVIEVNLLGVYRTLRPAIEQVIERRGWRRCRASWYSAPARRRARAEPPNCGWIGRWEFAGWLASI